MPIHIQHLINKSDIALSKIDDITTKKILNVLKRSSNKLQADIKSKWSQALKDSQGQNRDFSEARARVILSQLGDLIKYMESKTIPLAFENHIGDVTKLELKEAGNIILAYNPKDLANFVIPIETITNISSNMTARLVDWSKVFSNRAEQVIVDGLINGHGFNRMAGNLAREANILYYRAETIVRTETMNASDFVRRERYKASDIKYVQRIATQDKRLCGWCAARAGNVYKIDDAPQLLHPNDRCYNAPWKQEWFDAGLIDNQFIITHADEARSRTQDQLRYNVSPLEKAAGFQKPPEPIWTPKQGFI